MNSASVDLIYLDPPFNSKRLYWASTKGQARGASKGASFKDVWKWKDVNEACLEPLYAKHAVLCHYLFVAGSIHGPAMQAYLAYMAQRILEMHRVLKDTGSLYLHCNPTASHYLKIVLDAIFGKNNFKNEVVWCYKSGGASAKHYSKKHDILLFYCKEAGKHTFNSIKEKSYNRDNKPYRFKGVKEYLDKGEGSGKGSGGHWFTLTHPKDYFFIDMVGRTSKERTGYPTQKPLALIDRIIKASSKEGDVVLDPFCGCATTCVSAEHLGRPWIGIDIEEKTRELVVHRLSSAERVFTNFIYSTTPPKRTDVEEEKPSLAIENQLYVAQDGCCYGCCAAFEPRDLKIDYKVPKSKGGKDYKENYQLLCKECRHLKKSRLHDYLMAKAVASHPTLGRGRGKRGGGRDR